MKRFLCRTMAAVSLLPGAAADPGAPATHWSLRPLARPPVPAGPAHPIDAFVRAKLDAAGLTPSPEADRRTLIRRICHDLTGLPPTPEEVDRFLAEPAEPDPVPALVGRLLASPHHGERWARHWLDTIHFADTHGFEHDIARDHAWPYRDYVIAAMNRDTPWPRFIREQLAADAFFPDQPELTPALGFLGAGTFDLSAFSTAPCTSSRGAPTARSDSSPSPPVSRPTGSSRSSRLAGATSSAPERAYFPARRRSCSRRSTSPGAFW